MRHSGLPLIVATSLLLGDVAVGATRPHYGGTLHVAMRAAPTSLDPADSSQPDSSARRNLSRLIFDTLVILDDRGRPQPAVASSWQSEPGTQRWQFYIRRGVTFHDGMPVTSDVIAASLRVANPSWKVFPSGEMVVIECDSPAPNLPAELSQPRYGIARRDGGRPTGTGAFSIAQWDPGKKLTLVARDEYWGGRAFLDSIEIEMGKSFREQMMSLDLGKADVIEVAPEQARRAALEGQRVESSSPAELMALVFVSDKPSLDELRLRESFALSIDRHSLSSVLLQGTGEAAGGLLPNWMSGYAFLFPTDPDLPRARQLHGEIRPPTWQLSYDASDPTARVVAERIALNARDAGLTLQVTTSAVADLRLVRVPLASVDPRVALTSLAAALKLPQPKFNGNSAADLYAAESALLQSRRIIPLLHLRSAFALGANVKNWVGDREGNWRLQDVWLGTGKP